MYVCMYVRTMYQIFHMWKFVERNKVLLITCFIALFSCTPNVKRDNGGCFAN
jgi:hypothetical protein